MSADTYTALIRLARVVDIDVMHNLDALDPGQDLFQKGAAVLSPPVVERGDRVPVYVNHDKGRPIGYVRELTYIDDTDGLWLTAFALIEDRPEWLQRNSDASIAYHQLERRQLGPTTRILRAWVSEVSVLAPTHKPANKGAKVWSLRRSAAAAITSDRAAAAGTTRRPQPPADPEMDEFRRRCDVGGWENSERILQAMQFELGYVSGLQLGFR